MTARDWLGLGAWLLVTFAAAALGALSSRNARDFYAGLVTPAWAPPGWLFGPVWTLLYLLMAIAAWMVWRREGWDGAGHALALYLVQLACNAAWSWLFFARRRVGLAFADVVLLLLLIAATMHAFARVDGTAALLLAPYLAWVAFATALTFAIWRANVGRLSRG